LRETTSQSKQALREQRILDVAANLIVRYGYDKTSVSDIAKEAGVSKGAIYLHFDSKDDLLHQLILCEMLRFIEEWKTRMQADTSDNVFSSMYTHVLTIMQENDFLWALFSNQRRLLGTGFLHRSNSNVFQQRLGLSTEMLTRLKEAGAIRQDIEPDVTAYVFNMLNYGYLRIGEVILDKMSPPTDKVIDEIGQIIQRYLEPKGDGNPEAARNIILGFLEGGSNIIRQMLDNDT